MLVEGKVSGGGDVCVWREREREREQVTIKWGEEGEGRETKMRLGRGNIERLT